MLATFGPGPVRCGSCSALAPAFKLLPLSAAVSCGRGRFAGVACVYVDPSLRGHPDCQYEARIAAPTLRALPNGSALARPRHATPTAVWPCRLKPNR